MLYFSIHKLMCIALLHTLALVYSDTALCLHNGNNSFSSSECTVVSATNLNITGEGNIVIQICSEDYFLESDISITRSHSVSFRGMPSVISCESSANFGIYFSEVNNLTLQDIMIKSCGTVYSLPDNAIRFVSSMYVVNCTNVRLERVAVSNSSGNGVTMFDNDGTIKVLSCTFEYNYHDVKLIEPDENIKPSGSGLHIVLSYCTRSKSRSSRCQFGKNVASSNYLIKDCIFRQNGAKLDKDSAPNSVLGFSWGGGLCIVMEKNSLANILEVVNCSFINNLAWWGAGMYVAIQRNSTNNTVEIRNCTFTNNTCGYNAGGGLNIGYLVNDDSHPENNKMAVRNCTFIENKAYSGGGISFFTSPSSNTIKFVACIWIRNQAVIGSALDISPQQHNFYVHNLKTEISLLDCTFDSNDNWENADEKSFSKGLGTFTVVGFHIYLKGSFTFNNNKGSAMHLTSTKIEVAENSSVTFTNNRGFQGGAINMQGFTALLFNDHTVFTFINNSATDAGGAIYQHTSSRRDLLTSKSCFIRYQGGVEKTERNVSFLFQDNVAGSGRDSTKLEKYGHSIYTISIRPCFRSLIYNKSEYPENILSRLANFMFINRSDYEISTSGRSIELEKGIIWAIPGAEVGLPIKMLNDFSEEVSSVYHASVECINEGCSVGVDDPYTYLTNKLIRFHGNPRDKAMLILESIQVRELVFEMQINLQNCPPGYILRESDMRCICSVQTANKFPGIQMCNLTNFTAQLFPGYWVGYDNAEVTNGIKFGRIEYFLYGLCPRGHCTEYTSLPNSTSLCALDTLVCGESRTGRLCGECRAGYAAQYHDDTYQCKKPSHDCRWGWLFYLVSEILPVTIFFIAVMALDIRFTNGVMSSLVLYFQLSDTIFIRGSGGIPFPDYAEIGLEVYSFFTRIYNLKFFSIRSFSFCVWKSATMLDLVALRYITIFYASALVAVIILVLRYCRKQKINYVLVKMRPENAAATTKSTIVHGVSGFLVICYSECARTSLLLLTPGKLNGFDKERNYVKYLVPFYNGELNYFRGKHLAYALPAVAILLTVGILPPLLLVSYPLCYRVFSVLKIGESKVVKLLCACIPLEKFKPFFDSFQQSYKDQYRFFSGLHFLYRLITLATFAFTNRLITFYILAQVDFTTILTIHALCQPYKQWRHNMLDILLFMNLSVVNAMTIYNYYLISQNERQKVNFLSTVQIVMLYLPLAFVVLLIIRKLISKAKKCCDSLVWPKRSNNTNSTINADSFPLDAAEYRLQI